eukprot:s3382_g14.t1
MQTPSISWKNKGPQQSDHKTKERHKRTPEFPANLGSVRIRAEGVPAPIQFGNSRSPVPTCNAPESHDGTANAVCFPTSFHLRFAPLLTRPVASAVRLHKRSSADGMPLLRVLISVWFLASAKTLNSGYFELCSTRLSSPSISGHVQKEKARRNSSSGHSCERGIGTIVWYPDGSSFCCPAAAAWCGGCAAPTADGTACGECIGGWTLEDGQCTACMDYLGWHDEHGRNCFAASQGADGCSSDRFHGASARTACCGCGGGLRAATPFRYYTEPLLIGQSAVTGHPLPRTASHYSVDADCKLLEFNLTINGRTGQLQLQHGCDSVGCGRAMDDFQVTCIVTAHEGDLEASAQLHILASNFLVYESLALVVPDGTKRFPARFHPGAHLGGLALACIPTSEEREAPWQLEADGSLSVDASRKSKTGLTNLTLPWLSSAPGGLCQVRNASNQTFSMLVVLPETWAKIEYPHDTLYVTPGASFGPPLNPSSGREGHVAPTRFSAHCEAKTVAIDVVFDELTGVASAAGFTLFHLNVQTGALKLTPEERVAKLLDGLQSKSHRGRLELSCKILGLFEWQVGVPVPPIVASLDVLVQDSTCWQDTQIPGAHVVQTLSGISEGDCRGACRSDLRCGAYNWQSKKCHFLAPCGPNPVEDCQLFSAYVKITNCSAEHTCMNLTGSKPVWLYSGLFCPIAFERAVGSSAGWVFRKSVATPQDVFYLAPETSDAAKCDGALLLIRSNRTWDFENTSSKYIELFGEHVACLTADVPHGVVQATFDKGRQDLKIKNEQTFIGKGLQLTLKPQACQAPVLSPEMSEALMVDDPSTTTDMDYTLHACDCFPESWTGDPVTPKSAGQLPPGSDNEYVPLAIEIAKGSLVCDQESLLAPPYMLDGAHQEECHHACQLNTSCRFFWMGSAAAVSQCRLYTACRTLLTEAGASGTLAARSSDKVCRRADPEKCWASFRRAFLFAGTSKSGPSDCAHQALLEQCDVNLMMGGEGVEDCSRCV